MNSDRVLSHRGRPTSCGGRRRRAVRVVALAAVAVGAIATACTAPPPPRSGATGPDRYVSLGDSWVSGPLISAPVGTPIDCGRAALNFPSLVAEALDVAEFVDVSCGGASTKHLSGPQTAPLGGLAPPQFDALTPDTTLVTLGIGGNDVGFPNFALDCVNLLPFPLGPPPLGQPCVELLTADGGDQMAERIAQTRPRVLAALAGIRERSPRADVFLIGYPVALPDDASTCFPQVPMLAQDIRYLRDRFVDMNAMLADAAAEAGAHYVDTYSSSIGHDVCRPPGEAWVNALGMDVPGIPMHPNLLSHRNTATVVAQAVRTARAG